MSTKKTNYLPLVLLPVIFVLCFGLWSIDKEPVPQLWVDSATGVYDLRDFDFQNNFAHQHRPVEYVIGELLTPQEFALRDDIQAGEVPWGTKACTMRVRYSVPDGINYGIGGYAANYASSVYINGKWIFDAGKPALTLEDEQSTEAYRLFSAQPVDGMIEIVIQTSAFANVDPVSGMEWFIGEYENIRIYHTRVITQDIIIMTCYILLTLVSLLLFFTLPSYKATGWLSLLSIVWAVRVGLKNTKILLTLFPEHTWNFVYKTEIITSPLTIILLALVLYSAFAKALPKWFMAIITGGSALAVLTVVLLPYPTFFGHSRWSNPIIYWSLAVMLLFILASMRRTRFSLPQFIILAGMGMVVFSFMWDEYYYGTHRVSFAITQPMMLVFIMFMSVATILETMRKTVRREVELAEKIKMQETELIESRVAVMLSQIQPHFLYNTLATIENMVHKNTDRASKMIISFSEYLRENMDSLNQSELIPFERELNHVKVYLDFEKMRFKDDLEIIYDCEFTGFYLPILTIQPIVENAVRHGVMKKPEGGTVSISTRRVQDNVEITITDDGLGFDPSRYADDGRSHVGLENVKNRLMSQCGGTLKIESRKDIGTKAIITVPAERRAADESNNRG